MRISALFGLDTTLIIKRALTRDNELMRISALIGLDTTLIIKSALTRDNELENQCAYWTRHYADYKKCTY